MDRSGDDGPKLREEKQYQDFYPNLASNSYIPIFCENSNQENGLDLQSSSGKYAFEKKTTHYKQIIYEGKTVLEPLKINEKLSCYAEILEVNEESKGSFESHRSKFQFGPVKSSNIGGSSTEAKDKTSWKSTARDTLSVPYVKQIWTHRDSVIYDQHKIANDESILNLIRKIRPLYDIDEQDLIYVGFLNKSLAQGTLTVDIFEILITVLEREWHSLEKRIPPTSLLMDNEILEDYSDEMSLYYHLYGADDGSGLKTDRVCAVCDGTESLSSNAIVFCDGCDIAVHQECYGIVFIPEGQWLCRRCLVFKNRQINCVLCPSHTGAFKQTGNGSWAHVVCGLWLPELYFANLHYMEPIEGLDSMNKSRWKLVCYICKLKVGACIQCAHKSCFAAFHVTCAKRAGLYMNRGGASVSEMGSNIFQNNHSPQVFCHRHSPFGWHDCRPGIEKAQKYFAYYSDANSTLTDPLKLKYVESTNKWQTSQGTPIAPNCFVRVVQKISETLHLHRADIVALNICKYWSMKRESKLGAPLIRDSDQSSYSSLSTYEMHERTELVDLLVQDLSKLKELTDLVVKRTEIEASLLRDNEIIDNIIQDPEKSIVNKTIKEKFTASEPFIVLKALMKGTQHGNYLLDLENRNFQSFEELNKMIAHFFDLVENADSFSRSILQQITKLRRLWSQVSEKLEFSNIDSQLHLDFEITTRKSETLVKERPWRPRYLQQLEGLSDTDETIGNLQTKYLEHILSR